MEIGGAEPPHYKAGRQNDIVIISFLYILSILHPALAGLQTASNKKTLLY